MGGTQSGSDGLNFRRPCATRNALVDNLQAAAEDKLTMPDYSTMEAALELLAPYGPDLRNGLTSHAPMVAEALCAMGRSEAVLPWLEKYRAGMLPKPAARQRIERREWRQALGQEERTTDWKLFFDEEFAEDDWHAVAARWTTALAPAICASAAHGVIRVGHAVRSLSEAESPARLSELAEALGYWAACYQTLPTAPLSDSTERPLKAIMRVPLVPQEQRQYAGTIVSSLHALNDYPPFAPVIAMVDTRANPVELISELTETFARVYLANAATPLGSIVFVHGVTDIAAVRSLLPLVSDSTARELLRYAWQASCALYASFGFQPPVLGELEAPSESLETLIDMAVDNGDEHAIKFTEVCLREYALNRSPAYLAAARHAVGMLVP